MKFKRIFMAFMGLGILLPSASMSANPSITEHHLIYVSVHPDDMALTFGGGIQNNHGFSAQDKTILIYEPFTQTNYTADVGATIFTNQRIAYVTALRYNEDADAFNDLFTMWSNYSFFGRLYPELSLRYHLEHLTGEPPFIDDGEDFSENEPATGFNLFGEESKKYYAIVYNDFLRLFNQPDCAVFLPSAVSNRVYQQHPDHFLVREAAIQAANTLAKTTIASNICQVYFGQDQPYTNGDLPGSITMINDFRQRLGNQAPAYEITYPMDKDRKWAMLQNYKSQLDPGYARSLLLRSNETFYLWPKAEYIRVTPDPTCDNRPYCTY